MKSIVISDSSNTTISSERDLTSIKKCGNQLLGRELCRKPCAFYQGSWSANQYAPIVDVRLLTRLYGICTVEPPKKDSLGAELLSSFWEVVLRWEVHSNYQLYGPYF